MQCTAPFLYRGFQVVGDNLKTVKPLPYIELRFEHCPCQCSNRYTKESLWVAQTLFCIENITGCPRSEVRLDR